MKKIVIVVGILVGLLVVSFIGLRIYTKSFSPEGEAVYDKNGVKLVVKYGRPYKKERTIFGGLVPYNEVWRTGANEPTVFTTESDLEINGQTLKKGSYALFTIPGKDNWQIIFNNNIPSWGVGFSGEVAHDTTADVLVTEVPAITTKNMFEQFTIDFEQMHDEIDMILMWDQTLVVVPMRKVN